MTDNYWELTLYLADGVDLQGFDVLELNATTNWIYNNENRTIDPLILALRNNVACRIVDYHAPLEIRVSTPFFSIFVFLRILYFFLLLRSIQLKQYKIESFFIRV